MEESENQLIDNLDDSEEGDMIMVSSSEQNKEQDDESEDGEELEEGGEVELSNDEANDAKENDDNVPAESEVVETVDKKTPKPVQKKTKKKDKGKPIGNSVVSISFCK